MLNPDVNGSPVELFGENGLLQAHLHGTEQNLYIVSEDRVENLDSYSLDFQIWLAIISVCAGSGLSSLATFETNESSRTILYVSVIVFALSLCMILRSYRKMSQTKKKMFTRLTHQKQLTIIEASYGSTEHKVEIADVLNSLIKDNRLSATANNDLGGDPHVGVSKKLHIKYLNNGAILEKEYNEGESVSLP